MNEYNNATYSPNPGFSEKQILRAEELLAGWSPHSYVEKRRLSDDYRAASLRSLDRGPMDGFDVLVSRNPVERDQRHVVLSRGQIPEMPRCEITIRKFGQLRRISGIFEPSHPGRRAEDRHGDTRLFVSFFYPE